MSDEETLFEQRIKICESCDKLKHKFITKICGECGCILDIKARVSFFKCPLNKWEIVDGSKK